MALLPALVVRSGVRDALEFTVARSRPSVTSRCRCLSALARRCSGGRRIWNEHPDGTVLPRRDEQLAVAGLAQVEIGAGDARAHLLIDELLQRHVHPVATGVPYIELHFLDRRHGAGTPAVGLLHRGEVGGKDTAVLNVAENKLAAQCGNPAAIREAAAYRPPFVVVVHRDRILEAVFLAPVQDFLRQREELVQRAAAPAAVL